MKTQSFQQQLKASGPDSPRTPAMSREERLTQFMPPPVVEMLEARRLMALTVGMNGTTLEITGNAGADFISVFVNASDNSIHVSDGTNDYGPYWQGTVTLVKILALGGNDLLYIDRNDGAGTEVPESCLIYGGDGNDSIESGDYADSVYGGAGLDSVSGFIGSDVLVGDADSDSIEGGDGGDTIFGGAGSANDTLKGNDGNDVMYGGSSDGSASGSDSMHGGAQSDTLFGEDGGDSMDGGDNSDTLNGGDGNDTFWANDGHNDYIDGGAGTSDSLASRDFGDTWVLVEIVP